MKVERKKITENNIVQPGNSNCDRFPSERQILKPVQGKPNEYHLRNEQNKSWLFFLVWCMCVRDILVYLQDCVAPTGEWMSDCTFVRLLLPSSPFLPGVCLIKLRSETKK